MTEKAELEMNMKKEILIAIAGLVLLTFAFALQFQALSRSSPLALLVIEVVGLLLSVRFRLAGGALLLFGGLALAVHPLLFSSSYWLLPGASLVAFAGFSILIKWWQQNGG
jgi:hypothetical protein